MVNTQTRAALMVLLAHRLPRGRVAPHRLLAVEAQAVVMAEDSRASAQELAAEARRLPGEKEVPDMWAVLVEPGPVRACSSTGTVVERRQHRPPNRSTCLLQS